PIGTGRQSRLRTIPGVGLALRLETRPRQILLTAHALLHGSGALNIDARADADVGELLRGGDLGDTTFNARVDVPSLDIGPYIELGTGTTGITGVLVGHAVVDGTPRRPRGTADLVLSNI